MVQLLRSEELVSDFEVASRQLLRRLAATTDQMEAAEPGTDDFLEAYNESCRLREMYRQVRDAWEVPAEVRLELEGERGAGSTALAGTADTTF